MTDTLDGDVFDGSTPIAQALEQLRLRLLDLTGRNRLLNFKHTAGKSLQLVPGRLDESFRRLVLGQSAKIKISPVPEPRGQDYVDRNGKKAKPDPKDHAAKLNLNVLLEESTASPGTPESSMALYFEEDLGRHCRKLEREARLAIEETGANMLYLVLGMLEFPDPKDADRKLLAPLVCVPVRLESAQEQRVTSFKLCFTGEEVGENLSLREKLRQDYAVNLPAFPEEDDGIESYLSSIEKEVARIPGWRVRRSATLALLSFANMLLVRDLDPDRWRAADGRSYLLEHPIIHRVFQGGHDSSENAYAQELNLDTMPEANLPLVFDADSSQHSAIVEVMAGKSLVIEGPPGTGKSQTITNIIAACLYAGKSVLFVAEKLAALQVVKSRLERAGLDPFLLELHSNKTSKRQVLDSLEVRIKHRSQTPNNLGRLEAQLRERRDTLREHALLLNSQVGNQLGCTIHQILWRAESSRSILGGLTALLAEYVIPDASSINAIEFEHRRDRIRYLAKQFQEIKAYDETHAFWGFFPESLAPNDDLKISAALKRLRSETQLLSDATRSARTRFGFEFDDSLSAASSERLLEVTEHLKRSIEDNAALDVLPRIFGQGGEQDSEAMRIFNEAEGVLSDIIQLERSTHARVDPEAARRATFGLSEQSYLTSQGLGELSVQELTEVISQLAKMAKSAADSVRRLDELSKLAGLEPVGSPETYSRLDVIAAVSASAPKADLHLRNDSLFDRDASDVLLRGIAERNRIHAEEEFLDTRLYLDQAPSDTDLRAWILTLREGATWYRVFQRAWRIATRAHKSLLKDKRANIDAASRLADFEQLSAFRRARSVWMESPRLRSLAGTAGLQFESPLERSLVVAKWLHSARGQLDEVAIEKAQFDPVRLDERSIMKLGSHALEVKECLAVLKQFDEFLAQLLASGTGWDANRSWPDKLQSAGLIDECLNAVLTKLADAIAPDVRLREVGELLACARELASRRQELATSAGFLRILGSRHESFRADHQSIVAAIKFGSLVASSDLPLASKQAIWTSQGRDVLTDLGTVLKQIQAQWRAVREQLTVLNALGRVDPDSWILGDRPSEAGSDRMLGRLVQAVDNLDQVFAWSQYVYARGECARSELRSFVELLEERQVAADLLEEAFAYRFYASIAESLIRSTPSLNRFSAPIHATIRDEFASLDREIVAMRGKQIACKQLKSASPPIGNTGVRVAEKTEMSLIDYLLPQQRPRVTVREMMRRAGQSIRTLKPCFMMGPQAVAQFLHAVPQSFDVVIMDEASQLRPEEAIGAIVRGSQLVVVGDPKQLPPTSFFSRSTNDDDTQPQMAAVDAESILDIASSHFRPIRSLRWHYRSTHESLIAFSNEKFYRGDLVVFPSPFPRKRGLGVRSHYVTAAVYESQLNQREAGRVVDFVVDHILHHPDQSLGVVALNVRQRDLIAELLEERLKSMKSAEAFRDKWKAVGQDLFVKNLENVQGDERDAIIISTTFGPPPGGTKPHQNFGPIGQSGGWRRLNVLFTRARRSVLLVTSLKDTDIAVDNGTPLGTRALRDYLIFAATGRLHVDPGRPTESPPESPFEESVISALSENGYVCEPQVGVASFRIDIGVRHPQYPHLFLAGIECDGASYHSGITVRDRDRIRQEILESLGWQGKLWRIWSTEWFRNPRPELKKLLAFLERLKQCDVEADIRAMTSESAASSEDESPTRSELSTSSLAQTATGLITDESADEVAVGDHVTYKDTSSENPERELEVTITRHRTELNAGLIAESTPLARVLLGATVGEPLELHISSQLTRRLKVIRIGKPSKQGSIEFQ